MPIYITQGRYTRDAIKGMIIKPEDRADAVSRLEHDDRLRTLTESTGRGESGVAGADNARIRIDPLVHPGAT